MSFLGVNAKMPLDTARKNLRSAIEQRDSTPGLIPFWDDQDKFLNPRSNIVLTSYLKVINRNPTDRNIVQEDINLFVQYCNSLYSSKKEASALTLSSQQCSVLVNILSTWLITRKSNEERTALFSAFEKIVSIPEIVIAFTINAEMFWRLSCMTEKQEKTNLTALEVLLQRFEAECGEGQEKTDNEARFISLLAASLMETGKEEKKQNVLDKLAEISKKTRYASSFKTKLEHELNALSRKSSLTSQESMDTSESARSSHLSSSASTQEDELSVVVKSLATSTENSEKFQNLLQDLNNVKRLLEDPELLYWLSQKKNHKIGNTKVTVSRNERLLKLLDAIDKYKQSGQLTDENIEDCMSRLGVALITESNSTKKDVISIGLGDYTGTDTGATRKSLGNALKNAVGNGKVTHNQASSLLDSLDNVLRTAQLTKSLASRQQKTVQNFQTLLSHAQSDSKAFVVGCEDAFSALITKKLDTEQQPAFFKAVLENTQNIDKNLQIVAQALMGEDSAMFNVTSTRKNFWDAVSTADIDTFPLEHRITLVGHILDCLKAGNIEQAAQENAVKFIFEQLDVVKGKNKNIDVLLPLLLDINNFKTLKGLYNAPQLKSVSDIKAHLKSIFTECYTPKVHDTLYKYRAHDPADKVPDWEFLVQIKHGKNIKWAESNESKIVDDPELKLREEQDYREATYQKEGAGFIATWNLMNNRHKDNYSFQNFFKTIATYLWATRPMPVYTKEKANVIDIKKEPEGEVAKSGAVADNDDDITVASEYSLVAGTDTLGLSQRASNTSAIRDLLSKNCSNDLKIYNKRFCRTEDRKNDLVKKIGSDYSRLLNLYNGLDDNKKDRFIQNRNLVDAQITGMYDLLVKAQAQQSDDVSDEVNSTKEELCKFMKRLDSVQVQNLFVDRETDFLSKVIAIFENSKAKEIITQLRVDVAGAVGHENKKIASKFDEKLMEACSNNEDLARDLAGFPPKGETAENLDAYTSNQGMTR